MIQGIFQRNFNRGLESQWERDVRTSRFETRDYHCPDEECVSHHETIGVEVEVYMGQTLIVGDIECPSCGTEMEAY